MTGRRISSLLVVATALVLAGCTGLIPQGRRPTVDGPCAQVFSADRCRAILSFVVEQSQLHAADVRGIDVHEEPPPSLEPGQIMLSGGPVYDLVVHRVDGSTVAAQLFCVGISRGFEPACMDQPVLQVGDLIGGGWNDTPEDATPLPTLEPAAIGAARPLRIDRLRVRVDQVGPLDVELGQATLPDGVLSVGHFTLVDPWPDSVLFTPEGLRLELRSLDPGEPFVAGKYAHGWHEGVETVRVVLVGEVVAVDPGASFEIAGVEVG